MIQTIAIQAYFAMMRNFFTRQGFDLGTRVIYGADAQGNLDLLDKDLANRKMDRKSETDRENVRSNPYTYLFWTKGKVENIIRRSAFIRDGIDPKTGAAHFRKVVSIKFPLILAFISNKGNTVEDFEEAFAAEWQNIHNAPISLKWAFPDESETIADDLWMNATVIQELGSSEMVSYKPGDLFAYSWIATIHLNVAGEFASKTIRRLKRIVVDLYDKKGIPLAAIGKENSPTHKEGIVPETLPDANLFPPMEDESRPHEGPGFVRIPENTPKDPPEVADYIAADGTVVEDVPKVAYLEKEVLP